MRYTITFGRGVTEYATVTVEAETEEQARAIGEKALASDDDPVAKDADGCSWGLWDLEWGELVEGDEDGPFIESIELDSWQPVKAQPGGGAA